MTSTTAAPAPPPEAAPAPTSGPRELSSLQVGLLGACGYDPAIVRRLTAKDGRFFVVATVLSFVAAFTAGLSVAYGTALTLGPGVAPPVLGVVGAFFVLNLLRLHHAGSGYPLHSPIEEIGDWRPAGAAVVVLFVLGAFLTQPLVLLVLRPWLDHDLAVRAAEAAAVRAGLGVDEAPVVTAGLIGHSHAAWDNHLVASSLLTVLFSLVICLPALLRRTGARAVRLYESERWVIERMLVDDAWADCLDGVTNILKETAPGFSGELHVHYADPPYNTRPLVFGLDPALLVSGRLRFVRSKVPIDETPTLPSRAPAPAPAPAAPPTTTTPAATTTPAPPKPTPPKPTTPTTPTTPTPTTTPTTPTTTSAPTLKAPTSWAGKKVTSVARLTAQQARDDVDDGTLQFIVVYLEKSRDDVQAALQAAPADAPLHKVFPEWNKLPTLLLKSGGFALDAGLAPLIAIAVDRPVDQVEKRLRAAPRDKKVSSVFAPELARRLLRSGGG